MKTVYLVLSLLIAETTLSAALADGTASEAWQKAQYRFTPEVEAAFLDAAKAARVEEARRRRQDSAGGFSGMG